MATLIAILQFFALQGITLDAFTIEQHDRYYSATHCEVYYDKQHIIAVCVQEKKLIITKDFRQ
jgi:hypothetical protein